MRSLVTGAAGFVGRHVVSDLQSRGYRVTAAVRNPAQVSVFPPDVSVEVFDLQELATVDRLLKEPPDVVVHCAWPYVADPLDHRHLSEALPVHCAFLDRVVAAGVRVLVVTGSCLEYGERSGELIETDPVLPHTPYGRAKILLSDHLAHLRQTSDFRLIWARLFYTYGPGQRVGSLYESLMRAGRLASSQGVELEFELRDADGVRDFIPVEEAVAILGNLTTNSDSDGIFNICSGHPQTVRQLATHLCLRHGLVLRLTSVRRDNSRMRLQNCWGSTAKIQAFRR